MRLTIGETTAEELERERVDGTGNPAFL